LIPYNW